MDHAMEQGETPTSIIDTPPHSGADRPDPGVPNPADENQHAEEHPMAKPAAPGPSGRPAKGARTSGDTAMSREEQCRFLRECEVVQERQRHLSESVTGQEDRLRAMRRQSRRHRFHMFLSLALSVLFLLLLIALPTPLKVFRSGAENAGYPSYFVMILLFVCLYQSGAGYVRLWLLRRKIVIEDTRLEDERYRLKRADLHLKRLRERDLLPEAYWIHTARLRSYLTGERADTIPDAIRLMEEEEAGERLHRELFSRLDRALALLEKVADW